MSITLAEANSRPPVEQPDPASTDSIYLLRLLEKQPSCLIRVDLDGTLLAVNEAGLKLLGTEALHQVLGRSLKQPSTVAAIYIALVAEAADQSRAATLD